MPKHKPHPGKSQKALPTVESPGPVATDPTILFEPRFWIAPLITFVCLLALYVATLAPSVLGGDSGELTAAALTGGVPHPPGYPLFAMLARAFAALPLGQSPILRVNLLSAVSTAAACGLLCAVVQLWTRSAVAGASSAALFGTNAAVWLHAVSAEVFGLNALFVGLTFLLWICAERTASRRYVLASAFVCGLAMCNHHTFAFVGIPLLLRSLWVTRHHLGAVGFGIAALLGLLGLLPYLYLIAASASSAAVSWGDQTTFNGFVTHILRLDFGTFNMGRAIKDSGFADKGTFIPALWTLSGRAFVRSAWIAPLLAAAGIYLAAEDQRERKIAFILGGFWLFYIIAFSALCNLSPKGRLYLCIINRFSIQSDFMLAIAAGPCFAALLSQLRAHRPFGRHSYIAWSVPVLMLLLGAAANGSRASQRNNRVFQDFAQTALASLPQKAVLITMGDHVTGAISYFHEVENLRSDVIHLDHEMLSFPWYRERKQRLYPDLVLPKAGYGPGGPNLKELIDGNRSRSLAVIDDLYVRDDSWTDSGKLATQGPVHLIVPAERFPTFKQWAALDRKAMGNYDVIPALRHPLDSWEHAIGELVLKTQGTRAHVALVYAVPSKDPAAARRCVDLIEDIISKTGGDPALQIPDKVEGGSFSIGSGAWRDLGVCYEILGQKDHSYFSRVTTAVERFIENAAPDDPELEAARQYLKLRASAEGNEGRSN